MKMVVAMIQPQQLPDIKAALHEKGFNDMTCTNVLGTVANKFEEHKYRGATLDITRQLPAELATVMQLH